MIIPVSSLPSIPERAALSQKGIVYENAYSVTHVINNRTVDRYILESELAEIERARSITANLIGSDAKYTYSGMARQIGSWIGVKSLRQTAINPLVTKWHFQACYPCIVPDCRVYDMKGAYWQIACKSPSLICTVDASKQRVIFGNMDSKSEGRWERVKRECADHKKLRLNVIGVNMANWKGNAGEFEGKPCYWSKGERKPCSGFPPTPFQSLAILTVRIAYELTQLQAREIPLFYANADCIAIENRDRLKFWDNAGIDYRCIAEGEFDCCSIGVWNCGGKGSMNWQEFKQRKFYNRKNPYFYDSPVYHSAIYH